MFFSILIPVYNVEKYIRECIDSVLSQDEQDFEMVLVDDGSTDNSGIICDEYMNLYPDKIRVIHKQNEGLLLTRRRAIREARGEWFIHLDSDDYMMPGTLETIRHYVTEYDADLFVGNFVYGQRDAEDLSHTAELPFNDIEIFENEDKHRFLMQFLYGGSVTAIWQKAAHRSIVDIDASYEPVGYVSMMEDHLQSLPMLDRAKKIVYINKPIVYYRYNEESITKKKGYDSYRSAYRSMRTVYNKETDYLARWEISAEEKSRIYAKHFRKLSLVAKGVMKNSDHSQINRFVISVREDDELRKDFKKADKKVMGMHARALFICMFYAPKMLVRILYGNGGNKCNAV